MLIKAADSLAQQISGGDVACEEEQDAEADRILHTQMFAIYFGGQQLAHHIFAWLSAALLKDSPEVVGHLIEGHGDTLNFGLFRFEELGVAQLLREQGVGPAPE